MSQEKTDILQNGSHLTLHDEHVLHRIFSPNLPFSTETFEEPAEDSSDRPELDWINDATAAEARRLEHEGVEAANSGNLAQAIQYFTESITLAPDRSSGYNNRAQAYRLLRQPEEALEDLNLAIEKSDSRGPVARQALCQRGLLRKLQVDENGALEDFKKAAALGSEFAKGQVVSMNPYAAMCGAAVAEMMQKVCHKPTEEKL